MQKTNLIKIGLGGTLAFAGLAGLLVSVVSCGTAPTPFIVQGSGNIGNEPPTLTFLEPVTDITRGQGDAFLIRWTDSDPDSNAQISFSLVGTNNVVVPLVGGIDEDEATGPNQFRVPTTFVAPGSYNLVGTIDDGVNDPVSVTALVSGSASAQAVTITIVGPGEGPQTVPPQVAVVQPAFNRAVAQDDVLTIVIQPTEQAPTDALPYDPDSESVVVVALDTDQVATLNDLDNPGINGLIILETRTFAAGFSQAATFNIPIDVATIPPLPDGEPYYVRATIEDGTNNPVHAYGAGTISVVTLAAGGETGVVDLYDIGRNKSGARFQGFNPAASLGSKISTVTDFDSDGVDDFIIVAQFGNPQNVGPVGEAYLVYGLNGSRFGGTISANAIADTIPGAIFQGPPVRISQIPNANAYTEGIVDVNFLPDQNGDGRPEIIFGLPHVHGAYDSMDFDPGDSISDTDTTFMQNGCYPDRLVNNRNNQTPQRDAGPNGTSSMNFYAGGMAVVVQSTNRDNSGFVDPNRLTTTTVALELSGQYPDLLDAEGPSPVGTITARADNSIEGTILGSDSAEAGRISGARFIAGAFDNLDNDFLFQSPRAGQFGATVASIGDLNSDSLAEIIVSAPRNERYLNDLLVTYGSDIMGPISTQYQSTRVFGSILVLPGGNYNLGTERELASNVGTSTIPWIDHRDFPPIGACGQQPEPRKTVFPAEAFEIHAENIDDWLGGASSAGDFNQDGLDDILCGAPRNDRNAVAKDSGAVYIIYSRSPFGTIDLKTADDPVLRPPMLRIRGVKLGDQIGWKQASALDVNDDGVDDVLFGSPHTDAGSVTRASCAGTNLALTMSEFDRCQTSVGSDVFHGPNDTCRDFDYDFDGDIDDDDLCVFCCLAPGECTPDDSCVFGQGLNCCDGLVDNGFVGIVYGDNQLDGDRSIQQLATSQLPGVWFYGSSAGDQAGYDVSSAGDFNEDGYGDILVVAPGVHRTDSAGRERLGVVYLILGGPHLNKQRAGKPTGVWNLNEVGSTDLPGVVFMSPYVIGRPNEAAPRSAAFIGDVNNDGFSDIAIGVPQADFIDPSFPQGPFALSSDAAVGRRTNAGDAYIIYGSNFGTNRISP